MGEILSSFGVTWAKLIAQVLIFLIVYAVLKKKAFGPVMAMLEERKARIAEAEQNLEKTRAELEGAETRSREILSEANASADRIVEEARQHQDDPEVYIKSDVAFHASLARATHNELFAILLDSLVEVMIELRLLTLRVPGIMALALGHHERILEAVGAGDADAARAAMDTHMDQAADTLRQSVGAASSG